MVVRRSCPGGLALAGLVAAFVGCAGGRAPAPAAAAAPGSTAAPGPVTTGTPAGATPRRPSPPPAAPLPTGPAPVASGSPATVLLVAAEVLNPPTPLDGAILYGLPLTPAGRSNTKSARVPGTSLVGQKTAHDRVHGLVFAGSAVTNAVSAYKLDAATGDLGPAVTSPIQLLSATAAGPFAPTTQAPVLAADPLGRFLFVANPAGDSVGSFAVDPATGTLAWTAGRGVPTGTLPVSLAVGASGSWLFCACGGDGTVSAYAIGANGSLVPSAPVSTGVAPGDVAAVVVDPTSTFLYVTLAASNAILPIPFDAATGTFGAPLAPVSTAGRGPSALVFHPGGRFLYSVDPASSSVSLYAVAAGVPTYTGSTPTGGQTPVGAAFDGQGLALYVLDSVSSDVAVFACDPGTGALTAQGPTLPVAAGATPAAIFAVP